MDRHSEVDPLTAPLTYPGHPPQRPAVLVTGTEIFGIQPMRAAALGQWPVQPAGYAAPDGCPGSDDTGSDGPDSDGPVRAYKPLDRFLRDQGVPPLAGRTPILSVGSNASPAQIQRKMANAGLRLVVPITQVRVHGLVAGVSAHVSKPGYVPATPVADPSAVSDMWVLWLDPEAARALDDTEPNYQRIRLSSRYPVRLRSAPLGLPVRGCGVYVSRHGHLVDRAGEPRILTDQATLIAGLLADVPALTTLAGTTPGEWIRRTRDERVRDGIRAHLLAAGIVRQARIDAGRDSRR
jgi:hypothetical protein